jgi:hypothetical protein
MPFHLIAFAPFILLVSTGLAIAAISLILRLSVASVKVVAAPPPPLQSAAIRYFPALKARPLVSEDRPQRAHPKMILINSKSAPMARKSSRPQ